MRRLGLALLAAYLAVGSACSPDSRPSIHLAVAASLGDVIPEVAEAYRKTTAIDVQVVFNLAGSGALAQQVVAAPRADLFLSASESWMDQVEQAGKIVPGSRRPFLTNSLVIAAHREFPGRMESPADLASLPFRYLAIGAPESVPAGRYARDWLESVDLPGGGSLWSRLRERISPAPDVRAALAQVEGNRDVLGIVYATDAGSAGNRIRILYEIPPDRPPTIHYVAARITTGHENPAADAFLDFLSSPEAAAIFRRHGFAPYPP